MEKMQNMGCEWKKGREIRKRDGSSMDVTQTPTHPSTTGQAQAQAQPPGPSPDGQADKAVNDMHPARLRRDDDHYPDSHSHSHIHTHPRHHAPVQQKSL